MGEPAVGAVRGISDSSVSMRMEAEIYISSDPCRSDGCSFSYDIPEDIGYYPAISQVPGHTFQTDGPNSFDKQPGSPVPDVRVDLSMLDGRKCTCPRRNRRLIDTRL